MRENCTDNLTFYKRILVRFPVIAAAATHLCHTLYPFKVMLPSPPRKAADNSETLETARATRCAERQQTRPPRRHAPEICSWPRELPLGLAFYRLNLSNINMELAERIGLELLLGRLVAPDLR